MTCGFLLLTHGLFLVTCILLLVTCSLLVTGSLLLSSGFLDTSGLFFSQLEKFALESRKVHHFALCLQSACAWLFDIIRYDNIIYFTRSCKLQIVIECSKLFHH